MKLVPVVAAAALLLLAQPASEALDAGTTPAALDPALARVQKLTEAGMEEVHSWFRQVKPCDPNLASEPSHILSARIEHRYKNLSQEFEKCLQAFPDSEAARAAHTDFVQEWTGELEAIRKWEQDRAADPHSPEPWLDLAHHYYHNGPSTLMIECHEKAIAIDPHRAELYQQYATALFLFRKDARDLYGLTEQEVFDRALRNYRKALLYDPENFDLARDSASSYSVIKPLRIEDAVAAWNKALEIAKSQLQREDCWLNLARLELHASRFAQAHQHLALVTSENNTDLRARVQHNLTEAEQKAAAEQAVKN
ncbi:MAG: hypothetical protein HY300_11215 [Verrucomicrobia bacterium]|nr:hypothetical protein [Verrucomicrobiota bacterium]